MHRLSPLLAILLCGLAGAFMWTVVTLYSVNSLLLNDRWIVEKRILKLDPVGSDSFLLARNVLARNRLDLGTWWGFQGVTLKESIAARVISFSFRLADGAYLAAGTGAAGGARTALFLSRAPGRTSALIEISADGEVSAQTPLPGLHLTDGWHEASIEIRGHEWRASVDGVAQAPIHLGYAGLGHVGFRSGFRSAQISRVNIVGSDGLVIHESFGNWRHWKAVLALNVAALLGIALACVGIGWLWRRRSGIPPYGLREFSIRFAAFCLFVCVLGAAYHAFDYIFWSTLPLSPNERGILDSADPVVPPFEILRSRAFSAWYFLASGFWVDRSAVSRSGYNLERSWSGEIYCPPDLARECRVLGDGDAPDAATSATCRIAFVGSSQTRGMGATTLRNTWFVRSRDALSRALAPSRIEFLNVASSAATSASLLAKLRRGGSPLPDVMVIDLANNDAGPDELKAGIGGFLDLARSRGIATILIEEPNSPEDHWNLQEKYQVLRALGAAQKAPVLPADEFMSSPAVEGTGFVWWDNVHLTDYGQRRFADWLVPRLAAAIRSSGKCGP